MQFVRPFIAQYYRRGKSLGYRQSRDFSSSSDFEYPVKMGVVQYWLHVGAGLAAGSGIAFLIADSNAGRYKKLEQDRKDDERYLEELQQIFGAKET